MPPVEAAKFGQDRQGAAPLPLARIAEPRDGGEQFVHRPLHELGRLVGDRVDGVTIEKLAIEPAGMPPVPLARQCIAQVAQPCRHARVRIGTGPPAERLRKHAPDHQGAPESDGLGAAKRKGGPVAQILGRAQVLLERDAIPCGPAREHDSRHPEGILPGDCGHQIARRTLPRPIRDVRGEFRPPVSAPEQADAVAQFGIRDRGEGRDLRGDGIGQQQVVGIEEMDEVAARRRDAGIARAGDTAVRLAQHPHRIAVRLQRRRDVVGRSVVDHQDLKRPPRLRETAFHCLHAQGGTIVDRDQDRHQRPEARVIRAQQIAEEAGMEQALRPAGGIVRGGCGQLVEMPACRRLAAWRGDHADRGRRRPPCIRRRGERIGRGTRHRQRATIRGDDSGEVGQPGLDPARKVGCGHHAGRHSFQPRH